MYILRIAIPLGRICSVCILLFQCWITISIFDMLCHSSLYVLQISICYSKWFPFWHPLWPVRKNYAGLVTRCLHFFLSYLNRPKEKAPKAHLPGIQHHETQSMHLRKRIWSCIAHTNLRIPLYTGFQWYNICIYVYAGLAETPTIITIWSISVPAGRNIGK